ncbi:CRISPR-associated endonuclease Cas2 [Deinococcus gobiensis]|uniref:CRISPR-associated endoribonuclease Cas2 n=1 Tax=Deinococcus gobiensis (strain DSM 21396 / JCM 16679 / CGMCC 1.7299 / I-0) TaxID=745776 RepID=H8H1R4_DEIGI|nr:CRISPR-associated endonuclease Cas2 [Deinococcus gobiensis]AFD27461.1 Crispr-associated protein cas2 [Deinococcus gobiensis I-0]
MPRLLQDPRKAGHPILVLYDVGDDKCRTKVMTACKDYGLGRWQYSAYHGRLTGAARRELEIRLEKAMGASPGLIAILQLEQWQLDDATLIVGEAKNG